MNSSYSSAARPSTDPARRRSARESLVRRGGRQDCRLFYSVARSDLTPGICRGWELVGGGWEDGLGTGGSGLVFKINQSTF